MLDKLFILFLFFVALVDPSNNFGFRNTALLLIPVVAFICIYREGITKSSALLYYLLGIFYPLYGFFIFTIYGKNFEKYDDFSYIVFISIAALIFIFKREQNYIFGIRLLNASGHLISLFIVITAMFSYNHDVGYISLNGLGYVGIRDRFGYQFPYIHYQAQSFMIFSLFTTLKALSHKFDVIFFVKLILLILSIVIVDSRMLMAISLALLSYFIIKSYSIISKFIIYFVILSSFVILIVFYAQDILYRDAGRFHDLLGYAEIFSNPLQLFFGQGFYAKSWSDIFLNMIGRIESNRTEFTYIELVRVFGISSLFFFLYFFYRLAKFYHFNRDIFIILLSFLLLSVFNPLFFSIYGFLPIAIFLNARKYASYV